MNFLHLVFWWSWCELLTINKIWQYILDTNHRGGNSSVGRASDWKARSSTDAESSPRCGKGFFSQSRLSCGVHTAPACNRMHHLCACWKSYTLAWLDFLQGINGSIDIIFIYFSLDFLFDNPSTLCLSFWPIVGFGSRWDWCTQQALYEGSKTLSLSFSGVALIAKFCVNIACSGCRTHFTHITASPYTKWQHRLNKPYASLVDAASLNTRSTCKLSVISAIQVSQWRAESGQRNIHVAPRKLPKFLDYKVTVKLFLKSYPCAL